MAGDRGVVWILGAGFSKPLGGPLLHDLISERVVNEIRLRGIQIGNGPSMALNVYSRLKRADDNPLGLWSDPEEFLARLEAAGTGAAAHLGAQIEDAVRGPRDMACSCASLLLYAKMLVAAASDTFLVDAEKDVQIRTEQWEPFIRWARSLQQADSVITFNYDRVLDLLTVHSPPIGDEGEPPAAKLTSPIESDFDNSMRAHPNKRYVATFHMHGHVDWARTKEGVKNRGKVVAYSDPTNAVLGTPGPTKKGLSEGPLKDIWDKAIRRIRDAHAIVFVGYRFPESDNYAKRRLLDAIWENRSAKVHIVLGPESDRDVSRLTGMLEWAGVKQPTVHHMYCQDFFGVFERKRLLVAPRSTSPAAE